jgi:hypothetical protein
MTDVTSRPAPSDVQEGAYSESGWLRPRYWHWLSGFLFFLACLAGSLLVIQRQPAEYSSSAVVSFEPIGDRPLSGASMAVILPRFVAYATSGFVAERTGEELSLRASTVADAVSAGIAPATANMTVLAVSEDPETAQLLSQSIAAAVLDESSVEDLVRAQLVSPAEVPDAPSGPNRPLLMVAALMVATLGGAAVAYAVGARRHPRAKGSTSADGHQA